MEREITTSNDTVHFCRICGCGGATWVGKRYEPSMNGKNEWIPIYWCAFCSSELKAGRFPSELFVSNESLSAIMGVSE